MHFNGFSPPKAVELGREGERHTHTHTEKEVEKEREVN